jgi:GNAT superfamily N-acetyltransferase
MSDQFHLRQATIDDAEIIGYHRARMFHDMGQIPEHLYESFQRRSQERVHAMLISGEYVGWLAIPASTPEKIVAGAGVQLRTVLPHPATDDAFAEGSQAVIINVFTEPDWRRQGLAERLLKEIIDWSREQKIDRLVLHASADGRALYQRLGFVETNEMRLQGL